MSKRENSNSNHAYWADYIWKYLEMVNIETSVSMACFCYSFFNVCLMRQKSLLKFLNCCLNTLIFLLLFCIPGVSQLQWVNGMQLPREEQYQPLSPPNGGWNRLHFNPQTGDEYSHLSEHQLLHVRQMLIVPTICLSQYRLKFLGTEKPACSGSWGVSACDWLTERCSGPQGWNMPHPALPKVIKHKKHVKMSQTSGKKAYHTYKWRVWTRLKTGEYGAKPHVGLEVL